MKHYTANIVGNHVAMAKNSGYHAYFANNVTAIEIIAKNKTDVRRKLKLLGLVARYIFE